jgi:hypothetical protein
MDPDSNTKSFFFLIRIVGVESKLSPLGTSATNDLLYLPRVIMMWRIFGGMKIGRGNRSTRGKPAPAPLCPPQIQLVRPGLEPGPPRWEASD